MSIEVVLQRDTAPCRNLMFVDGEGVLPKEWPAVPIATMNSIADEGQMLKVFSDMYAHAQEDAR